MFRLHCRLTRLHTVSHRAVKIALTLGLMASAPLVLAASFTIIDGQTETTTQTLNDNETGTIEAGGTLSTGASTAVSATGATVTVTNSGSISTTGNDARGILSTGANATITITNSGSISTAGSNARGIVSTGLNATITNSGSISTAGGTAYGIRSIGINAIITNSGSISTTGNDASGIYTGNTNATVTNSGSISTAGDGASGIVSGNTNASITNSGSISTAGGGAYGIVSTGLNATITNSGSISTAGTGAHGIRSTATNANAIITNSGSISTTGGGAIDIYSSGTDATITNSGSISTAGVSARGIYSSGANASITNSGSISTTGASAYGIVSTATDAIITNSGSISTVGNNAYGIYAFGANGSISNSGNISTSGDYAHSIVSEDTNASITNSGSISTAGVAAFGIDSEGISTSNSGSISTTGNGAHGIRSTGADASISNSGLISATGAGAYAIYGGNGTNQTVNILAGSRIVGAIDLLNDGGDADVANIYGSVGSAVLTFENTETINVFMDNAVLVGGKTVVVVDPTGESITGNALSTLTSGAHQVISQRMQRLPARKPVQVAALELSPGMLYQPRGPVLWGQLFGYSGERGAEGAVQAYDHDYKGFVTGYERDYARGRVGLLAGVANSDTHSNTHDHETDSAFLGAYGHLNLGQANLTASLLLGFEDHDNRRWVLDNVNGVETARGRTDSVFISPSLTLSRAYIVQPEMELRPSATLTYSVGRYDGYDETGTTNANLDVGSRTIEAVSARLQMEAANKIKGGEVNLRAGVQHRHIDADDVDVSLGGSHFQFSAASDDDVSGGFIGAGVALSLTNKLELVADLEAGSMSGDEDYLSGQLSLQYWF